MIYEFNNPIPTITPMGDGYILYVRDNGTWENDVFAVVLTEGGRLLHFTSDQIRIHSNSTFGIKKDKLCQTTQNTQTVNCFV